MTEIVVLICLCLFVSQNNVKILLLKYILQYLIEFWIYRKKSMMFPNILLYRNFFDKSDILKINTITSIETSIIVNIF